MKAFIFDFDGVVVDSERYWLTMDKSLFPALAPGYNQTHATAMMGMNLQAGYDYLVRELRMPLSFPEYRLRIEKGVHKVYHELAAPLPGLMELLDRLEAMNFIIAIASSSEREWIESCLTRLGLRDRFTSITTPADVGGKAKPAPDVYLRAAKLCGADPTECIAIEDSRNGILSATTAGMRCIAIQTEMNPHQDLSKADIVLNGLDAVTENILRRW